MRQEINIGKLIPIHNELRSPEQLSYFRSIDLTDQPVVLNAFLGTDWGNDHGAIIVHDGHHRLIAKYLDGQRHLLSTQFILRTLSINDYLAINLDVGWVTPFNPLTYVRKPDFFEYKDAILRMCKDNNVTQLRIDNVISEKVHSDCDTELILDVIEEFGPYVYREERKIHTMLEMAELYKE